MKRSESIRKSIGSLLYEQQLFQHDDNDDAIEKIQDKIKLLRSQLLSVEHEENSHDNENEDH